MALNNKEAVKKIVASMASHSSGSDSTSRSLVNEEIAKKREELDAKIKELLKSVKARHKRIFS